ncbi:acetate kinase [Rhodospirillum rubrum F11]|uniref:Acetate kinase n=3 Tax=Rhodospirillum rubrum TaxID=1085 RepID=Q2RQ02_RHORT|nr:acetate kinase [Rhodospirillum rubrum]AAN75023.1 AckA [Rhodospirillum rubrum ATCC 11170]ABC23793.1 acetate kinase [Rhodospirillum rubrum ATCC 11170]AEO49533.1 acetate kinase [Rhodospirillum rubrum F11]MBK5955470.1 acetate kinase [Rhodospirillum rubrum]QXG79742.1 acetate kinase [Rhodospirillum rubrum]
MIHENSLILVLNSGSSSLKFALFAADAREPLCSGLAECLGRADARLTVKRDGTKAVTPMEGGGHDVALGAILDILASADLLAPIRAVGHRVTHGGERFRASALITDAALADIEACSALAPLHNPPNLLGIRMARARMPDVPHVAVFDTSFHQTMPRAAFMYALPLRFYAKFGVRRYGFHGTSHRFVAAQAVTLLGLDPEDHGLVIAHLGNGSSATAVLDGRSVDTTMGMTPLEGLVMGTRSGDVDAGALSHIARQTGWSREELDAVLNKESGLLGLSGLSNDCRTLEAAAEDGNDGARLALDVFVHRLARHIGGLAMALPRLDAVVFTGGIGENSSRLRAATLERLKPLGLTLDAAANERCVRGVSGRISQGLFPAAAVIPTDEEWMIAQDTLDLTSDESLSCVA